MKVGIYADPHFGKIMIPVKEAQEKATQLAFEEMYEVFKSRDVDVVVCLGDFLHRSRIESQDVPGLSAKLQVIEDAPFDTYLLLGNHDQGSRDDSVMQLFGSFSKRLKVVSRIGGFGDCLLIAHDHFDDLDEEAIRGVKYVFTHEEYQGMRVNSKGSTSRSKLTASLFENAKCIYNGHIHLPGMYQSGGKLVQNVGALFPSAFGELSVGMQPSFFILDTEANTQDPHASNYTILPIIANRGTLEEVFKHYTWVMQRVYLRYEYAREEDLIELPEDKFLAVEYRKILDSDVSLEGETTDDSFDRTIDLKPFVEARIAADTSLSQEAAERIKGKAFDLLVAR